jgi:hypothetical protein
MNDPKRLPLTPDDINRFRAAAESGLYTPADDTLRLLDALDLTVKHINDTATELETVRDQRDQETARARALSERVVALLTKVSAADLEALDAAASEAPTPDADGITIEHAARPD